MYTLLISHLLGVGGGGVSRGRVVQCDAPYCGHPTNFFYKLANQDTRIGLTVTLLAKSNRQVMQQRIIENMSFCIL